MILVATIPFYTGASQDIQTALNKKLTILYSELKKDFNLCIDREGLKGIEKLKTECNVGDLEPLQNILFTTRQEHVSIYIDGFQPPGKIKNRKQSAPEYPGEEKMRLSASTKRVNDGWSFEKWIGYSGTVIVNFSIDENGDTFNQDIEYSSFGSGSSGKDFITNSIEASKKLQYPPATYLDKPISIDNYFITYRYEPAGINDQIPLFGDNFKSYNIVDKLIGKNKLDKALKQILEAINESKDVKRSGYAYEFWNFLLAKIYFLQKDFDKAIESSNIFLSACDNGGWHCSDDKYKLMAIAILAESYFKQEENTNLISIAPKIKKLTYRRDRPKNKGALAQANMYLGLTYLFEGQTIRGVEHLMIARRSTNNPKVLQIIDAYLDKIEKAI